MNTHLLLSAYSSSPQIITKYYYLSNITYLQSACTNTIVNDCDISHKSLIHRDIICFFFFSFITRIVCIGKVKESQGQPR